MDITETLKKIKELEKEISVLKNKIKKQKQDIISMKGREIKLINEANTLSALLVKYLPF